MQIKRKIYNSIKEHIDKPEITLIVGPRQAGKTTIAKQIESEVVTQRQKTLFLNLDIESDNQLFESQEKLLFAIRNQVGEEKAYIFIDEFQRKKNGGKFIKGIYDMNLPYKFIITGSGSIDLKEEVHESLAGRKKTFELSTLTFEEYINYETEYRFEGKLSQYKEIYPDRTNLYLQNYLTFGGYPKAVISSTIDQKKQILQEIYNSYLIKDISALLKVEKTNKFQQLVENLSILDGKLVNISQLASNIGISIPTIEKYLWYLEKTYIISASRPFSRRPLKEINKSYIYYFNDIGLKNLVSNNFDVPSDRINYGFDFQTFVYNELQENLKMHIPYSLNFWRTKDGAEVDIIIKKGTSLVGIEVKYSDFVQPRYTKSMRSFIDKYKPSKFYIVNKNFSHREVIGDTEVEFIVYADLQNTIGQFSLG